jgi:hypothetical protein
VEHSLHSLLHATGAYLNPNIFYNDKIKIQKDLEVMSDVMIALRGCSWIQTIQDKINMQWDLYKDFAGIFGFSSTFDLGTRKWWVRFYL